MEEMRFRPGTTEMFDNIFSIFSYFRPFVIGISHAEKLD